MKYLILAFLLSGCATEHKQASWHWDSRPVAQKPQDNPYIEVRKNEQGYLIFSLPVIKDTDI